MDPFSQSQSRAQRFRVQGRAILDGSEKLHVRGATYGTFRPRDGVAFPPRERVREDFAAMAASGVNAVRTYEPPPLWLLDEAAAHGLRAMVGLAWEQHLTFLDDPERRRQIVRRVRAQAAACEAHPALLCYAIGNEIPAAIVRWHGKRAVERFLERLYFEVKEADPGGLVTYVNYPSTEYLELPFLDLAAFNVYLEDERAYSGYLDRLQNLCGDRPLLLTEVGLDSRRNGEREQGRALGWQLRRSFAAGAAGAFVFAWTDEWHRGGHEVLDWDFGLVDRQRQPKPALATVRRAFAAVPFAAAEEWPAATVVVCSHDGARTLDECLAGVAALDYPDFELIVVLDGCGDDSAAIARAHGAIVHETDHRGLGHARNVGIAAARGEIVAFLDDDAYPDRDWLRYLAATLRHRRFAGVGGPNVPPTDAGFVAECVAAAPGGPIHVLVSDREAEHLPGCNMAFRKEALEGIGGFDERFRVAGDDVDVCWRLQQAGHRLGFSAGAVVIHHRRDSVRRYLRQQYGYGKAEALLERKWPSRYNRAGSSRWAGRIYEAPAAAPALRRPQVNYGTWGAELFQSVYDGTRSAGIFGAPEGLLLIAVLGLLTALGAVWPPLFAAAPALLLACAWILACAIVNGRRAHPASPGRPRAETTRRRGLTALLFLLQPAARLAGRLRNGLSPWRRRVPARPSLPRPRTVAIWSERWAPPQAWVERLRDGLAARGGLVRSGGPFDRWDLDLRAGAVGGVRIRTVVEEHGAGRQLLRVRIWPRATRVGGAGVGVLAILAAIAAYQHQLGVAAAIGLLIVVAVVLGLEGMATATQLAIRAAAALDERPREDEPARRARLERALRLVMRPSRGGVAAGTTAPFAGGQLENEERR
ncbi:MAG: glycosyltransferase [Actinobacteria bacterium]|nr:glycosyltransferase [Actinomycetota bacterium]